MNNMQNNMAENVAQNFRKHVVVLMKFMQKVIPNIAIKMIHQQRIVILKLINVKARNTQNQIQGRVVKNIQKHVAIIKNL